MREVPHFGGYDQTAVYTIKAVVQQTGIPPATLRAWERRYGILRPDRSDGGYRLYSQRDIAMLRWLKGQLESGVNISKAVDLLETRGRFDGSLEMVVKAAERVAPEARPPSGGAGEFAHAVLDALLEYDEPRAEAVLSQAFAVHPLEVVSEQVIAPVLVEMGQRWQDETISAVQEHFATAYLHRKLCALFNAYGQPLGGPLAVTGSAPGEWHDVGILFVSLGLRRHGWRVIYLGQNVPVEQLVAEVAHLSPDLVCVSATTLESASRLSGLPAAIGRLPEPRPRLVCGGRAFNLNPELRRRFGDAYLGGTASEVLDALA